MPGAGLDATESRAAWRLRAAVAAACLGLATLTLALPSAPAYDAWAWIVWGREVLEGDLRTVTGPSWKPLPIVMTAPFSLFGDVAPELWLVVARAATFGAIIAAAALAARLAGRAGGLLAVGLLLFSPWLWGAVWTGYSEGMLILCLLATLERHLAGRLGHAFGFGVATALLRPEAWPFLGLYAVWLIVRDPARLSWVVPGLALIPALWLLPELWGSGSLFRGADRALMPGPNAPAQASRPALAVLENAVDLTPRFVQLGLLLGVVMVALRRVPRGALTASLWLAALGLGWVAVVAAMTELGFSGINRYLAGPVAIAYVLAATGLAWTLTPLLAPSGRSWARIAMAGALGALVVLGVVRAAALDGPPIADDLNEEITVTDQLDDAIARAGGERRVQACSAVYGSRLLGPAVAWELGSHIEEVTRTAQAPGTILRARLLLHHPLDPPRDALAGTPGRRILARTERWEVEAACAEE